MNSAEPSTIDEALDAGWVIGVRDGLTGITVMMKDLEPGHYREEYHRPTNTWHRSNMPRSLRLHELPTDAQLIRSNQILEELRTMPNEWDAEIDHDKDKISITYTDRRQRPFQHLSVVLDRKTVTISTKVGSSAKQNFTLIDKSLDDIMTVLTLIDCPRASRRSSSAWWRR